MIVRAWKRLEELAKGQEGSADPVQRDAAQRQLAEMEKTFAFIQMDNAVNMRNAEVAILDNWVQKVSIGESDGLLTVTTDGTVSEGIPVYGAFAGIGNLAHEVSVAIPGAFVAGGSELRTEERECFRRRHQFMPFNDPQGIPVHMLGGVSLVCVGQPQAPKGNTGR